MSLYRQGDVLLQPVVGYEANELTLEKAVNNRLVLAEGEATGHAHTIDAAFGKLGSNKSGRFLVLDKTAELLHQEHAPIHVPAGTYRVIRQREYAPQNVRNVAD